MDITIYEYTLLEDGRFDRRSIKENVNSGDKFVYLFVIYDDCWIGVFKDEYSAHRAVKLFKDIYVKEDNGCNVFKLV